MRDQRKRNQHRRIAEIGFVIVQSIFEMSIVGIAVIVSMGGIGGGGRAAAEARACDANLRRITAAKTLWARDHPAAGPDALPALSADLVVPGKYLRRLPRCPAGGV